MGNGWKFFSQGIQCLTVPTVNACVATVYNNQNNDFKIRMGRKVNECNLLALIKPHGALLPQWLYLNILW